MEDFQIDIMIGSGTGSTSVKMDIPKFTLIGATTKLSSLSSPLRDRFGNIMKLDFYDTADLSKIVARSFDILGLYNVSGDAVHSIAKRSRGTPRIANRYVKILRDYATTGRDIASKSACDSIFDGFGVDSQGLDALDRKLLTHLLSTFGGRATGLSTLASVV